MTKLITATLAASAFALSAGAAGAGCFGHQDVTASTETPGEAVVMSTYDGTTHLPGGTPGSEEAQEVAKAVVECAEGQKDCRSATE